MTALLIAPRFFGYESDIQTELERQGALVTFVDERPSTSPVARAILRKAAPLTKKWVDSYYARWVRALRHQRFDVILIIKGEVVPRWFLLQMRELNPSARLAFYAWDSIANSGHFLQLLDLFDEAFTFDREDAEKHARLIYRPFFFAPQYAVGGMSERPIRLAFIGTLHSNRHRIAAPIFAKFPETETRFFLYSPARWFFFFKKYISRDFRAVPWNQVSFDPMSREAAASLFHASRAVLDIHHPGQRGLSPRTFEVLASGCKLITTNGSIALEPIYDPQHVVIIPSDPLEHDVERIVSQLETPPDQPLPAEKLAPYSVLAWVERVALPAAMRRAGDSRTTTCSSRDSDR